MAADFAQFKLRYPELVSDLDANQPNIELFITDSVGMVGVGTCPRLADRLILSHAAHSTAKSGANPDGKDDTPAEISSFSAGGASYTFDIVGNDKGGTISNWYKSTAYGKEFLYLLRQCHGTSVMTT